MTVKLGVPSKGRLMEKTFQWFGQRGIGLSLAGSSREYAGRVTGVDGVELVLLSAGEIPRELQAGRIHLGVTGSDLVREKLAHWEYAAEEMTGLGFGQADLVLAVPQAWVDVDTLDDLDAAAAAFRKVHVADYLLVDSQGATEGAVRNLIAEAIADITSTGETLRANHLKVLSDGLIHQSQATLFKARDANWGARARETCALLLERLGL